MKFFQKLRKKLLRENKIKDYLRYAFGEIILVVLGILIALQLNTLKENRKRDQIERDYLSGIVANLEEDIYETNQILTLDTLQIDAYTLIARGFGDTTVNIRSRDFLKAIGQSYITLSFHGSSIVFEDMKSSGHLNSIQSYDLRMSIQEYYNESANLIAEQQSTNTHVIADLKNNAFPDLLDLNSMIEQNLIPEYWRYEVDSLDLSFFELPSSDPNVRRFVNRISILKAYQLQSNFQHKLLGINALQLKEKIERYLNGEPIAEDFLPKELLSSIEKNDLKKFEKLSSGRDLNLCYQSTYDKKSLLALAIIYKAESIVIYLIDKGCSISQVCANKTPLMYAAKYGHLDLVKLLISKGADVSTISEKGKTALSYSIEYEHPEVEDYLREH